MLLQNRSISTNVTIGLVSTLILLTAILLTIRYEAQKTTGRMEIEQKADEYAAGLSSILAIPLWTLDTVSTEHIGSVYRQNDILTSLEVRDNRGNTVYSFGSQQDENAVVERTRDIIFDGDTIGSIHFTLSLEPHKQELRKLVRDSLLTLALAALVILVATGILLRIFMRRPLADLEHGMEAVSHGEFNASSMQADYRELSNIVATFKEMAATIKARENSLIQVNEALSHEVLERKAAEEARARSESTLKAIFNAAPVGIGQVRNRIISWPNAKLQEMTGYDESELNNRSSEFLYPTREEFDRVGRQLYSDLEGKATSVIESQWRTKTNEIMDVIISVSFIEAGNFNSGFVFTVMDITERKRFEAALRESEQRLHLAVTGTNDGLWDWNIVTGEVYYSPRYCAMLGFGPEELAPRQETFFELLHEDDRDAVTESLRTFLGSGENDFAREFRCKTKQGDSVWIMTRGVIAERDRRGRPLRMVGTHTDITERRNAEAMREKLIAELEDKNAELERFTYTVSHDLKSPIITIKGFLGMLERDLADNDQERVVSDMNRINQAADKMQQLLDELLELSRIGRLVNPPENIDLGKMTADVKELVSGRLAKGNIRVEIAEGLPVVRGDKPRIQEVLLNLMDNAAKFMTTDGEPLIEIGRRTEHEEGDDMAVIFVRDNGIGIKPEHSTKIFGLFDQLDPKKEGTGIGLALVQRIVETHGGHIWVESEGPGKGATFCFSLPLAEKA